MVAKGLVPAALVAHSMEMYGTMAVYLRLKGIVPPSTKPMKAGEESVAGMEQAVDHLRLRP